MSVEYRERTVRLQWPWIFICKRVSGIFNRRSHTTSQSQSLNTLSLRHCDGIKNKCKSVVSPNAFTVWNTVIFHEQMTVHPTPPHHKKSLRPSSMTTPHLPKNSYKGFDINEYTYRTFVHIKLIVLFYSLLQSQVQSFWLALSHCWTVVIWLSYLNDLSKTLKN